MTCRVVVSEAPRSLLLMETYYITFTVNNRYTWSSAAIDLEESGDFRSPREAFDALKDHVSARSLFMDADYFPGIGSAINAYTEEEFAKIPMRYSHDAMELSRELALRIESGLRHEAITLARANHRVVVTDVDIRLVARRVVESILSEDELLR